MKRKQRDERVYLIASNNSTKIGRSRNVTARLRDMQTANPVLMETKMLLKCADAVFLEAWLHEWFKDSCIHDEWFDMPAERMIVAVRGLIESKKIKAVELPLPVRRVKRDNPQPIPPKVDGATLKYCLWCKQPFWSLNPREIYCEDKNHRIYRSKQRSKSLYNFWLTFVEVFYPDMINKAPAHYNAKTTEKLAQKYGFYYSDLLRRFMRAGSPLPDQIPAEPSLDIQSSDAQSEPTLDPVPVHTSDSETTLPVNPDPLQQLPSQAATSNLNASAYDNADSSSDNQT